MMTRARMNLLEITCPHVFTHIHTFYIGLESGDLGGVADVDALVCISYLHHYIIISLYHYTILFGGVADVAALAYAISYYHTIILFIPSTSVWRAEILEALLTLTLLACDSSPFVSSSI